MSFLSLFKKSPKSLKPVIKKPRHRCPFYGFFHARSTDVLIDQQGNQCALIVTSYSPCQMEFRKQTPDWDKCSLNAEKDKEIIEEMMDSCRVFPDEFMPEDRSKWAGLSLREWMEYVMGNKVPRPQ